MSKRIKVQINMLELDDYMKKINMEYIELARGMYSSPSYFSQVRRADGVMSKLKYKQMVDVLSLDEGSFLLPVPQEPKQLTLHLEDPTPVENTIVARLDRLIELQEKVLAVLTKWD